MAGEEIRQSSHKPEIRERRADRQLEGIRFDHGPAVRAQVRHPVEQLPNLRCQFRPGRRRPQPPPHSREEGRADVFLQSAQAMADRTLGDADLGSRTGGGAMSENGIERDEAVEGRE